MNPQRPTYSASTKPTSTQVNEFITQIGNEVDSILLGRGQVVPITTPASLVGALKLGNAQGAAALAEMAQFPESSGMGETPHGARLWAMYEKFKKWLQEGNLPISGGSSPGPAPMSFHERHAGDETEPTNTYDWQKPIISKSKEF